MKLLTAVIRPEELERVVKHLAEKGITHMTVGDCHGIGGMESTSEVYRGETLVGNYRAKVKLDIAVSNDDFMKAAVDVISEICHSGSPTDGIIFVSELIYAKNIGSGKTGDEAL